jgi:hypothetical protein
LLEGFGLAKLWWAVYLIFAESADFEQNYVAAWRNRSIHDGRTSAVRGNGDAQDERAQTAADMLGYGSVSLFLGNDYLSAPILYEGVDSETTISRLRTFFNYLRVRRGLAELVVPYRLIRLDTVEFVTVALHDSHGEFQTSPLEMMTGEATGQVDCGSSLQYWIKPSVANRQVPGLAAQVQALSTQAPPQAIRFMRVLDRTAVSTVVLAPGLTSLVFVIIWLAVFLEKTGPGESTTNVQVVVSTAFTIASYLVTTGVHRNFVPMP